MKSDQTSLKFKRRPRADWQIHGKPDVSIDDPREHDQNGPSVTDDIQNTRINELERLVHTLSDEISDNKDTLQEILANLKGTASAQKPVDVDVRADDYYATSMAPRSYSHESSTETLEYLDALQHSIEEKFSKLARGWNALGRRIDQLEDAIAATSAKKVELDESTLDDVAQKVGRKLDDNFAAQLERKLSELLARNLSAQFSNSSQALHNTLTSAVETRFADILSAKLNALIDGTDALASRSELGNLKANINGLEARLGHIETTLSEIPNRLAGMQQALQPTPSPVDLGPLTQRISFSTQEIRADLDMIEKRVSAIPAAKDADLEPLLGAIYKMETHVDDTNSLVQGVGERFDRLHGAIHTVSINSEQTEARVADQNRILTSILETIAKLEVNGYRHDDIAPLQTSVDDIRHEIGKTHDALIKINTNQQTLATAFDYWGKETRNELAEIRKHLESARASDDDQLPDLTSKLNNLHQRFEELQSSWAPRRPSIWARIYIWLYGTDNWFKASWRRRKEDVKTEEV